MFFSFEIGFTNKHVLFRVWIALIVGVYGDNWATSWENLFMSYANKKGADQPAHSRSLISAFVVRCLDSIIPLVSISEISSLYLASVAEKSGLSLPLSQTPETGFLVTGLNYILIIVNNAVSLMNRLNKTESAVFKLWMLYFQRILGKAGFKP